MISKLQDDLEVNVFALLISNQIILCICIFYFFYSFTLQNKYRDIKIKLSRSIYSKVFKEQTKRQNWITNREGLEFRNKW